MSGMITLRRIFTLIVALILLAFLVWIGVEIYNGRYLHAVAISCTGSLLMWFAMGLGNPTNDQP